MRRFCLFLSAVVAVAFGYGPCLSFAQSNEMGPPAEEQKEEPQEETKAVIESPQNEIESLKDPFISALPRKAAAIVPEMASEGAFSTAAEEETFDYSSLIVTGLVWGTENPKAIINGEVYGLGDVINGGEVVNINSDGILFKYKEQEYLMRRHGAGGRGEEAK